MSKNPHIQLEERAGEKLLPQERPCHWLLMLDVDGTLLDIAYPPDAVSVPLSLKETLLSLHDSLGGALVLVSGRSINDLDALFAPLRLQAVGLHGAEIRLGNRIRYGGPKPIKETAKRLGQECREMLAGIPGTMVEQKTLSVAVHYRQCAESEDVIRSHMERILQQYGDDWHILPGKMVFEIKPTQYSKGKMTRQLMEMPRFKGRKPVYVGDDVTDKDALMAVKAAQGYAVKVTGEPEEGFWYAENALQVRRWLMDLAMQANVPVSQPLLQRRGRHRIAQSDVRLVVVSNRVAVRNTPASGGLAVAMSSILQASGGVWLGWSGKISEQATPHIQINGNIKFILRDLTQQEHEHFYQQFCNATLWPLLHYNIGLSDFSWPAYEGYQKVNHQFAELLTGLLKPTDHLWIHDFHFIPLAAALRQRGVKCRMGFFLHTPFPSKEMLLTMPVHRELMASLFSYNLVGFQTQRDLEAFNDYVNSENVRRGSEYSVNPETVTGHFPIGIQTSRFQSLSRKSLAVAEVEDLKTSLVGRKLILGVDRMDYSKGIVQRMKAMEEVLGRNTHLHKAFSFLQISPTTREGIEQYEQLRANIESMVGHINGKYADVDWVPIRFVVRGVRRELLAGYYRLARLCLVTPLRDGMNLVAKEFIAAQNPEDPGVLVLSRFAGAAEELTEALLVNPYDIEEMASAIEQGLAMPLEERQQRWNSMYQTISRQTLDRWYHGYLDALVG